LVEPALYPCDMRLLDPVGDPLERPRRSPKRPVLAGALLSLSVHAAVLAAAVALARGGEHGASTAETDTAPAISVTLVSALQPVSSTAPSRGARSPDKGADATPAAESRPSSGPSSSPPAPPAAGAAAAVQTAAPSPATAVDPSASDEYRRRLLDHISAYRRAPAASAGRRPTGVVLIRLAIDRQGDVLSVQVAGSSGAPELDDEAVATVWRAQPMPAIPSPLPERLAVILPVSFDPERSMTRARGF